MTNTKSVVDIGEILLKKHPNIFYNFHKEISYNDEPSLFQYSVNFKENTADEKNLAVATGISFDQLNALRKTFGEMVERYSLSLFHQERLKKRKYQPKTNMLDPMEFLSFSENQLTHMNVEKDIFRNGLYYWELCKDAYSLKNYYAPAQLIYAPYNLGSNEPLLQFSTSSGAACGMTLDDAIYSGICELIERDFFVISYLNKIPCPKINLENIKNEKIRNVIEKVERYNLEVYLIVTTLDLPIFSIAAIIVDRTGAGPAISVGLKAGLNKQDVIIGAIEESLMTRGWIRDQGIAKLKKNKNRNYIRDLESRAFYWSPTTIINNLDFWIKDNKSIDVEIEKSQKKNRLIQVKNILRNAGVQIYFSEITNDLFNRYSVHVVKVISPQLQQLYLDERYPYFGKKRILQVPAKLGFLTKHEDELFKVPHPFL